MVLHFSRDFNSRQTIAVLTKRGSIFTKVLPANGVKFPYNVEHTFEVRITVWYKKQYLSELTMENEVVLNTILLLMILHVKLNPFELVYSISEPLNHYF